MTITGLLGVESRLLEHLPESGIITAQFRIASGHQQCKGVPLIVEICARVYHLQEVQALGYVPNNSVAQGVKVGEKAEPHFKVVELPLPPVPYGEYAIVAKVLSDDDRYRRDFTPSECFAGSLTYGLQPAMMLQADLEAVYLGINNPLAEAEIRSQVRRGLIHVETSNGQICRAAEENGNLLLKPL